MEDIFKMELVAPYLATLIGLVMSLAVKDVSTSFVKGLLFKYNPLFNEGDTVLIDDEYAIIVKIGVKYSIFGVVKPDGNYIWRFVQNDQINSLKLEKVVREQTKAINTEPAIMKEISALLKRRNFK